MTIKEFEENIQPLNTRDYKSWFNTNAKHEIRIGGVYIRCVKLTANRVAFLDKTTYKVQKENKIRKYDEARNFFVNEIVQKCDEMEVLNKVAIEGYLDLLIEKDRLEKNIKEANKLIEDERAHCMFCGKPRDEVKKLIKGYDTYICDECCKICYEILTEDDDSHS